MLEELRLSQTDKLKLNLRPETKAFISNKGLRIIWCGSEPTPHGNLQHLSMSREDRYPDWDEMLEMKEHFFGDVDAMMVMPKKENYVNVHQFCFHIWQCPKDWLE